MRKAVDEQDAAAFCWACLEIARKEFRDTGKFQTFSTTDIKNLLQSIMTAAPTDKNDEKAKKVNVLDIKKYMAAK